METYQSDNYLESERDNEDLQQDEEEEEEEDWKAPVMMGQDGDARHAPGMSTVVKSDPIGSHGVYNVKLL